MLRLAAAGFAGMEVPLTPCTAVRSGTSTKPTTATTARAHGPFELNDVSVGFAAASMGAMGAGRHDPLASTAFPIGLGVAFYGGAHVVLHGRYKTGFQRKKAPDGRP